MYKFSAKIAGFLAIVALSQYVYTGLLPPKAPRQLRLLQTYLAEGTDIIYFGDSTIHHFSESDHDRRPISAMLESRLPGLRVGKVAAAAYNLDLFAEFVPYTVRNGNQPAIIIVPVNLGSFSPEWDRRPEYQFESEKLYARLCCDTHTLMFYRPGSVLGDVQPVSQWDYRESAVRVGSQVVGRVKDFDGPSFRRPSPANIRKKLTLRYMGCIDPEHRKLQSLVRIAQTVEMAGLDLVVYITPVDHETGSSFLGEDFDRQVAHNVRVVRDTGREADTPVLDLSRALPSEAFNWGKYPEDHLYPNEHLKERGRAYVAAQLSEVIGARLTKVTEQASSNSFRREARSRLENAE